MEDFELFAHNTFKVAGKRFCRISTKCPEMARASYAFGLGLCR
ncbi:hypothetical protein [Azospirillum argentinense]